MTRYIIELHNTGGIIDAATAETEEDAAREAVGIIRKAGELHAGDRLIIRDAME